MNGAFRSFLGFLKKLFLANLGLKALALFLAFHIYFLVRAGRPAGGDGGQKEGEPAPLLLPMAAQPQPQTAVKEITVTNTVTIVTNIVGAALQPPPADGLPAGLPKDGAADAADPRETQNPDTTGEAK